MTFHDNSPEIRIGLLGLGNVGSGVYSILTQNATDIFARTGKHVRIVSILVRDLHKPRAISLDPQIKLTTQAEDIIHDPSIHIVIETLGGEQPAFNLISQAIQAKKYVVTANKELIAKHRASLTRLARDHGVDIYYEASVGGGIPIIQTLKVGLSANRIESIYGILNGTTNYILTQIEEEKLEFQQALAQAQSLGFAEPDPTMDINGLDSAYKLTILAAIAFKRNFQLSHVAYSGIENLSLRDIAYADEFGYKIKLLAIGKRLDDQFFLSVRPTMIPKHHPLASVRNEYNAIYIKGHAIQSAMLYGKGAGSLPTGSAIVSDVIDIIFHYPLNSRRNLETDFPEVTPLDSGEQYAPFYLRLLVNDDFGVLEKIAGIFGKNHLSLLKVIQKDTIDHHAEIVILTHTVQEKNMVTALQELKNLDVIHQVCCFLQVGIDVD